MIADPSDRTPALTHGHVPPYNVPFVFVNLKHKEAIEFTCRLFFSLRKKLLLSFFSEGLRCGRITLLVIIHFHLILNLHAQERSRICRLPPWALSCCCCYFTNSTTCQNVNDFFPNLRLFNTDTNKNTIVPLILFNDVPIRVGTFL